MYLLGMTCWLSDNGTWENKAIEGHTISWSMSKSDLVYLGEPDETIVCFLGTNLFGYSG